MPLRLWRYVMVTDNGGAPNYDAPYPTLAICKPMIRKGAEVGDMIMGFAGSIMAPGNPNCVLWAGVISEKLTFESYWSDLRFRSKRPGVSRRPDNIYRPDGRRLVQVPNDTHTSEHIETDVSGRFVLVLEPAWRIKAGWGTLPVQLSELWWPGASRRGHRQSIIGDDLKDDLFAWLEAGCTTATESPQERGSSCPKPTYQAPVEPARGSPICPSR
jgi:hypothetical protein